MFLRTVIAFFLCISMQGLHAQSFQKILRKPDLSSHYFRKLLRLNDAEFVYLTTRECYRFDLQGNIKTQASPGNDDHSLEDICRITNGQLVIAGGQYTGNTPLIRLTRMDAAGTILREGSIRPGEGFDQAKVISSVNDHFFLVFIHNEKQRKHVDVKYLDQEFNILWEQHLGFEVYNELDAIAGENGGVEFLHISPQDETVHHFKFDTKGNSTEQAVQFKLPQDALTIIRHMIRTPDGGYLYSGVELRGMKNDDILLLKTDADGKTEWVKKHDLCLGDLDENIQPVNGGYMLLARVGFTSGDLDQNGTDIALLKLDATGNIEWARAYGTASMDYSRSLLVNADGSFLIGGQATTYYLTLTEPVLLKTDAAGNFPEQAFPYQLMDPSPIVRAEPNSKSAIQRLTNGALLPDGGMLMAGGAIDPASDQVIPFLSRSDKQGNMLWYHPITNEGDESVMMKPIADGSFLSITRVKQPFFQNNFHVAKLDAGGKYDWSKIVYTNEIRDAVMAPDGGYLLCGMEYEGMGSTTRKLTIIKLDKQGDQQWKYFHRIDGKWIYGRSIRITPENDILVAGFQQDMQTPKAAAYLSKVDMQGNLKWYKTFPHGDNLAVANKVIVTSAKDYLLTGYLRHPGDLGRQDILLLKTKPDGTLIWEKEFDIDKLDAGNGLIEFGGQYYIAGTAGQPEFGAKESFGVLFRTDVNGLQQGFTAFGKKGLMLSCTDLYQDAENKFHFMGTVQDPFGTERPFQAVLDHDLVLGITDPATDRSVQLYPVPANGTAYLKIENNHSGKVQVSITGISGIRLYTTGIQKTQTILNLPLPIAGYANGVYLVEIRMGNERIVKKLIVGK